jgi:UrcA family protein
MRAILWGLVLGLTAMAVGGTSAYAGALETVTVTGSRVVSEKIVGKSTMGADIREVSLSYRVNAADLDLASSEGKAKLEKRVKAAASAACKELDRLTFGNPTSPDDATCVKIAVDEAMAKVR